MSVIATKIKNNNTRFVFIFVAILILPLLQMIFGWLKELNLNEGRKLTEMPNLASLNNIRNWDDYLREYELFFNDHYGFRSYMIKFNSVINLKIFHASPRKDVIIGENGWLFYDSVTDGVSLRDFYGKSLLNDDQLSLIKNNLSTLDDEFKKRNIKFIVVMAPNKHTIYPEFLPNHISGRKGAMTAADQIDMIAKEADINYVDLRLPLLQAKDEYSYPLYYLTDTHWNELGAFVAFREIAPLIYNDNDNYLCNYKNAVLNVTKNKGSGDLARFINNQDDMNDYEIDPIALENSCGKNSNIEKNNRKIVVFGDSFATKLVYYLSQSFKEVVSLKEAKIDFATIDKEKPDIVIYEFVERYYYNLLQVK